MTFSTYKDLKDNRKPGDKVFGIRRNAFTDTRPDSWPEIQPVEGVLHSEDCDHPRRLAPTTDIEGHPWDDVYWNIEDWIICDTLQEAESELEAQLRAAITKLKEQVCILEFLLPSVKAEERDDKGCFMIPVTYRRDMSVTFKEVMSHCSGKKLMDKSIAIGDLFTIDEFQENVKCGGISDYDGFGDLIIDGYIYDNVYIWCGAEYVMIGDMFEIPFDRLSQIFEGHELKVMWYNK